MARFGIVDNKTNICVNIVSWEGAEWLPPRNHKVIQHDKAEIGYFYDEINNEFINPNPEE